MLSCKGNQDVIPDEIALRDEILELKRQVMILKRTNQQNLIKFRKYEDEAKRKDRQIEQLMDPRKNSEITKILSTKGAAILMNLKDQNNSLIQMILTKDTQIRRLVAEIKTSKLYSASRKTETHRAEVIRLRNLLIKSQEILKENIDLQEKRQRSIYINGTSVLDLSPTSAQSSPRDVDDLKFTIQSLETHIRYSNDLLAKKNQEIMNLSAELSALKRTFQCKSCKNRLHEDAVEHDFKQFSGETYAASYQWQNNYSDSLLRPSTSTDVNILEHLMKSSKVHDVDKVPHSAPSSIVRFSPFVDSSSPKHDDYGISGCKKKEFSNENQRENGFDENKRDVNVNSTCDGTESSVTSSTTGRVVVTDRQVDADAKCLNKSIRDRWRNVLTKYKQHRRQNGKKISVNCQEQRARKKIRGKSFRKKFDSTGESSDLEIRELKITEKEICNVESSRESKSPGLGKPDGKIGETESECEEPEEKDEIFMEKPEMSSQAGKVENEDSTPGNIDREKGEEIVRGTRQPEESVEILGVVGQQPVECDTDDPRPECNWENSENSLTKEKDTVAPRESNPMEDNETPEVDFDLNEGETQKIKKGILSMTSSFSPEIQRELENLYNNISAYEEAEITKVQFKSPKRLYRHRESYDSSFDSENSYPVKQEPQFVQVEVEINPIPERSNNEASCNNDNNNNNEEESEINTSQANNSDRENVNSNYPCDIGDDDGDDDDDVVVR